MYCIQYGLTRIISYVLRDVQCDAAATRVRNEMLEHAYETHFELSVKTK